MALPPTREQIAEMRRALAATDPALAAVDAATPTFPWRVMDGGFEGLIRLMVSQQVSVASAAAIWARVAAGHGEIVPTRTLDLGDEALRGFGLSRPKARYAQAIALACVDGRIDFDGLAALPDEQALAALTALTGVGQWTAEIYLMFAGGRLDLFPAGDVALQEAIRWADGAALRPDAVATRLRAQAWAPYRSVAAHLLWRWYGGIKRREIAPPGDVSAGDVSPTVAPMS
jgi:DNA-3-methyladenine glycosylase II